MNDHSMHDHSTHVTAPSREQRGNELWKRRGRWVFWAFALIAAAYLIAEHRAHLTTALPFLVILACPLLHMFMHRGHGHSSDQAGAHTHSKREGREND